MLRLVWLSWMIPCWLAAQALHYTGAPLRIAAACTEDDLRALRLTCPAERPCPVYLDLEGVESAGNSLYLTGNLHTEDATLFSILLASDDGGVTWREPAARVRGAGLDPIQFLDFDTGWAGGESLGSIPRDPFLLSTRDGGKTWTSHPILGESGTGTIDFFHFDSKTHGLLWIARPRSDEGSGREEAYESQDGGETWTLRQAAGEAPPKAAQVAGDYRLRTDRATGAYRVERHAPAGWQTVSSFLVRAGDCREPELPPPPPEEPPAQP
jgi:photosystem II stability/assembly factor-like uncharacterized protein